MFRGFDHLYETTISNNRVNFVYPNSTQKGKVLARELYATGNGYVVGKYLNEAIIKQKGYVVDSRGWINIKKFSDRELKEVIDLAMKSMLR